MAPSILAVLPLSVSILHPTPEFAVWLLLPQVKLAVFYSVPAVVQTIYGGYQYAYNLVSNFGLSALVRTEMLRLNVHTVLRTFWLLRVAEHAASLLLNYLSVSEGQQTQHNLLLYTAVFNMTKSLLVSGCETSTAVLGMTITVSYICHYVGCFFQWILPTEDDADDDEEMAMTLTLLFYILALDSDLTQLDPEKRFISLCRNFCVLFIFLIQLVHRDMLNPLLISLRRSYNQSLHRHIRTLAVCTPLIVFPASLLAYLWSQHAISTWLLDVSALSIQAIVKVVVSLMIHSLFLVHAYRSSFWEKMDDYVYYIQAFGNTVEFCVYIFTSCNYAWIIYFESGRVLRLLMMFNDGYNAWNKAWDIWSEFMKRRTVVNKINSLPDANTEQLRRLDDTCAICQEEMKSAKLTPCNHLFHGACLRNWLYEHNDCPMCRASF
jgi:E3 ubiquitin-protein ligase RNF139